MRFTMRRLPAAITALVIACAVALAGCASGSPGASSPDAASPSTAPAAPASGSTTSVTRPSSSALMTLVSPTQGESVTGGIVHVVVTLTGATIVSATTTNIRPDQGHIHLYVDNNLVSMNYGTKQDLPIAPGTHVLHVEFVASDHVPFNPRVVTPDVVFTVKP
jgi:hypothetical protein